MTEEDKARITSASRPTTIQVSTEGTDDLIQAAAGSEKNQDFARLALTKKDFGAFKNTAQIRRFVNSCLLNLSNHHHVDTSGLLPALASSSGSSKLRDLLLMPMDINSANSQSKLSFQLVVLPLVGVLTREAVCQSTLGMESNTIYATVYNYRQSFIEEGILPCMQKVLDRGSLVDDGNNARQVLREDPHTCVVTSLSCALLAVVRLIYEIITRIRASRVTLADTIQKLSNQAQLCKRVSANTDRDRYINGIILKEVTRLDRIVSDAEDAIIPYLDVNAAEFQSSSSSGPNLVQLRNAFDPPGNLSSEGPRSDNDHVEITDISILPTQNEITSTRQPFLPSNGIPDAPHFLPAGWKRQIDIHFRLYREDMMDPLRRSMMGFLTVLKNTPFGEESRLLKQKELRKNLENNVSLNVYGNVLCLGMIMDKKAGGNIQIQFSQPSQILGSQSKARRTEFWERSKNRLMHGGMVCLVSRSGQPFDANNDGDMPAYTFELVLAVVADRNTEALAKDDRVACLSITLADPMSYLLLLNSGTETSTKHWFLVESPGAYFGSYRPILKALQKSIPAFLPFGKYLAPSHEELNEIKVSKKVLDPPIYARAPTFKYDLSVLLNGHPCELDVNCAISIVHTVRTLQEHSTLDDTQATALVDTLCREVALINGPPGTGKTWIGVALMQVLLANKKQSECGPILCICYTNHALDQFLEHLLEKNIHDIVRVGARSKSESLEKYNLQSLMAVQDKAYHVRLAIREASDALENNAKRIKELENALQGDFMEWDAVKDYLMLEYPDLHDQFVAEMYALHNPFDESEDAPIEDDSEQEGFSKVESKKSRKMDAFSRWKMGLDIDEKSRWNDNARNAWENQDKKKKSKRKNKYALLDPEAPTMMRRPIYQPIPSTNRPLPVLEQCHIWGMSINERKRLVQQWRPEVQRALMRQLENLVRDVERLNDAKNSAYDEVRRAILRNCSVVGMTTNGAAKFQELVQKLAPKIIICEEAGEVLESHILAALSPSTQHLILIGDHLQLRPQIETYSLSSDSKVGKKYNLDKSLFERLVTVAENPLPMSMLTTQRRMRPCISDLIRRPLYPRLVDGDDVHKYPPVCGIAMDLFFMHHNHPEDSKEEYGMQSYSSTFEVLMAKELATYLIKNGYDKPGDIAILTPYLGQLSKLRDALKNSFMLVIDERDQQQLDEKELEEGVHENLQMIPSGPGVGVKNVSLQRQLTLRTIDNYQGEEAKIVIISLVRNNVTNDPSASGRIGFLKSPNRTNVLLSRAQHGMFLIGNSDLMENEKNGIWPSVIGSLREQDRIGEGLLLKCKNHPETVRLVETPEQFKIVAPNGGCNQPCGHGHPDDQDHKLVKCFQPCNRLHPICQHACPKQCGESCGDCMEIQPPLLLKCGHILERPRCHQKKNPSKITCRTTVVRKLPTCEHEKEMQCWQDVAAAVCREPCRALLESVIQNVAETCFVDMRATLDAMTRNHVRHAKNHVKSPVHMRLARSRAMSLVPPAANPVSGTARIMAAATCHVVYHFCIECKDPSTMEMQVDMIMQASLGDTDVNEDPVIVLTCGHALTMTSLDGMMEMSKYYMQHTDAVTDQVAYTETLPMPEDEVTQVGCPTCRRPIMRLRRYGRRIKDAQLSMRSKKFQLIQDKLMKDAQSQLDVAQARVAQGRETFLKDLSKFPAAEKPNPPEAPSRKLGHYIQESDKFPGSGFLSIMKPYGVTKEQALAWSKYVGALSSVFQKYNTIHGRAAMSPTKRLFETAVSSLYRVKEREALNPEQRTGDDAGSQDNEQQLKPGQASTLIEECIIDCGLPADGNAGSSYVESLAAMSNTLMLVLNEATEAMEIAGVNSGWYWFLEDLLSCCLEFTGMTLVASVEGYYRRREVFTRVMLLELFLASVQLMGRRALPAAGSERESKLATVDHFLELFKAEMTLLQKTCCYKVGDTAERRSEKSECLQRATVVEEKMSTAVKIARGELNQPLTANEKLSVFRAMISESGGSGHWYRCPNGHPYYIGECGMAMQQSRCPECGAGVGGGRHRLLATNQRDAEFENLYRA
ncbi:hypothetical protein BG004_001658 [Podila humilis]|nr:hypothetical protein BG004_001658 [Podila humilis]